MVDSIVGEKRRLRMDVRAERAARAPEQLERLAAPVADRLDELVSLYRATRIACFLSAAGEVPTREFLRRARATGRPVLLPVANPDGTLDWVRDIGAEGRSPTLRVPEPIGPRIRGNALGDVDLIFAPAALVDRHGFRLGWGGGYYDRALQGHDQPVFAVIHEEEFVDTVPREPHDEPITGVVTPVETRLLPVN